MPLKVVLAGHNLDRHALEARLAGRPGQEAGALSPETLSAAYARISRDPRHVSQLRDDARHEVEKARKSNQTIIFEMGHASVAEHAVFNLDVSGLSRLAVEALEHHRLASYTEKSQRYIRLEGEYVVPEEIRAAGLEQPFRQLVEDLAGFYNDLAAKLAEQAALEGGLSRKKREVESRANEDARYVLPLCAEAQLGFTANARTLELVISRLNSHKLAEMRSLGQAIYEAVSPIVFSVICYTQSGEYFRELKSILQEESRKLLSGYGHPPVEGNANQATPVRLVLHTAAPDRAVAAALLFSAAPFVQGLARSSCPYRSVEEAARLLPDSALKTLFSRVFCRMELWDQLPRAFECVDFTFEVVLSAAAFAQLKRHRMATLLAQDYDPGLGHTIPESIQRSGLAEVFERQLDKAEAFYRTFAESNAEAAAYALTNAHRRRVLFKINGRSLGHFSRLRCDPEAQWDIRELASAMVAEARRVMPLAGAFFGGKGCVESMKRGFAGW